MVDKGRRGWAIFALVVGIGMVWMWAGFLATGQVPELAVAPLKTAAHLAAEFLTAGMLVAGSVGLLRGSAWASRVHTASLGMLLYAVVQASGYFAQSGDWALVGMFAALALAAVVRLAARSRG